MRFFALAMSEVALRTSLKNTRLLGIVETASCFKFVNEKWKNIDL